MLTIEYENTFKTALSREINLFLGSGFSLLAQDKAGRNLPTGAEFKTELINKFNLKSVDTLTLPQISAILESENKDEFYSYINERFTIENYHEKYSALDKINVKTIFTTNVDDLIYKIFSNSQTHYIQDILQRGPSLNDKSAIDLITLHGSVVHKFEPMVFNTLDLASTFSSDPDKWNFLVRKLQVAPTLFLGYSLEDAGVLRAISPTSAKGRSQETKWIVLYKNDEGAVQYFKALGFNIIIGSTLDLLDYIYDFIRLQPKPSSNLATTSSLFPEESLPPVGTVPVRALLDFYLGAPPTWYDVYSGQLYRTSNYDKIVELINSKKNVVVIGIPASGKTTLMMQISANLKFEGHKIVSSSITLEKANLIVNKLNGSQAIVFVDGFTDDMEAFNVLLQAPNIILVGFDRDYVFELASHRLLQHKCTVLDITDLTDMDVQQIYSGIPKKIRIARMSRPKMESDMSSPSLFEVIESNTVAPHLKKRFRSVVQKLEKENQTLHDLLVMTCYVHACRVPVSYDTVSAFLRGQYDTYEDVYKLIDQLGQMVSQYTGYLVETEQDHFITRSTYVSEAILDEVSSSSFKRVFSRFHDQVSPWRTCRFDVFRRKAYDAAFAQKAFSDWKEGVEFYEKLVAKDTSPYLLQQGALYLLHNNQYRDAFDWIDRAEVMSGNKIYSIRNTHAIILFKANISLTDTDGTVKQTLMQSMQILAQCYIEDRRKPYHAIVFADQALQYYDLYPGQVGEGYLETAQKWLEEEISVSTWNRNMKRMKILVERKLSRI
jgi:ABC-type polar amino acid transport system ATPase subunit